MKFVQLLILAMAVGTSTAACPSFSIAFENDSCEGDIYAFNEAFQQVYLAIMRLAQGQAQTNNGALAQAPLQSLSTSNTETDLVEQEISDSEVYSVFDDGSYRAVRNEIDGVRNLKEELSDMAPQDQSRLLQDLEDFLTEMEDPLQRELQDCGTRAWCMQFEWCCIICPQFCPTRRQLPEAIGETDLEAISISGPGVRGGQGRNGPPPLVEACEYLADQTLPGCLRGADMICQVNEER